MKKWFRKEKKLAILLFVFFIALPASYAIANDAGQNVADTSTNNCAANMSSINFDITVPIVLYSGKYYSSYLKYAEGLDFTATNTRRLTDTSAYANCLSSAPTVASDMSIHMPLLVFEGYPYWADFQYKGNMTFTLTDAALLETSNDFVGTWKGSIDVEGEMRTSILILDNNLQGTYSITGATRTDTHLNIAGSVSNGTLSFDLPPSDLDIGDPDCVNWNVTCSGTLSNNNSILNLSCSGIICSSTGGQFMSYEDAMVKQ